LPVDTNAASVGISPGGTMSFVGWRTIYRFEDGNVAVHGPPSVCRP